MATLVRGKKIKNVNIVEVGSSDVDSDQISYSSGRPRGPTSLIRPIKKKSLVGPVDVLKEHPALSLFVALRPGRSKIPSVSPVLPILIQNQSLMASEELSTRFSEVSLILQIDNRF